MVFSLCWKFAKWRKNDTYRLLQLIMNSLWNLRNWMTNNLNLLTSGESCLIFKWAATTVAWIPWRQRPLTESRWTPRSCHRADVWWKPIKRKYCLYLFLLSTGDHQTFSFRLCFDQLTTLSLWIIQWTIGARQPADKLWWKKCKFYWKFSENPLKLYLLIKNLFVLFVRC